MPASGVEAAPADENPAADPPTSADPPTPGGRPGPTLRDGERVVMVDSRDRRYMVRLRAGSEFHTHAGVVAHDEIIGSAEGSEFRSGSGARYLALRPTLADHVLKMPRGAQVIYPKDLAAMLMLADVTPGLRVFESGVGSGALSSTLLRAGADVTAYELRDDFAERARANVVALGGDEVLARYDVRLRDAYECVDADPPFDRALLDLPEPWRVVPHLTAALRPGGIVVVYNPSITQVVRLRRTLDDGAWALVETLEVLHRTWHVEGESVRPDHRMVAHTGFVTHARRVAP